MMAAVAAGRRGHRVTLLEKNEKLGKKIYITGKGRCNFTNACDVEQLFGAVVSNPKFLYSAIYGFDNSMTMEFFREMGMPWKVERGNRVFPVSNHSSDVTKALERALDQAGVKVLLQTEVKDIRDTRRTGCRRRGKAAGTGRRATPRTHGGAACRCGYRRYGRNFLSHHGIHRRRVWVGEAAGPRIGGYASGAGTHGCSGGLYSRHAGIISAQCDTSDPGSKGQRTLPGIRGDALYALWGQRSAGAYCQQSGGKKAGGGGNSRGEHRPEACIGGKTAPGTAASGIFQGAEPAFRKCSEGGIAGENGTGGGGAFPHPRASAGPGRLPGSSGMTW